MNKRKLVLANNPLLAGPTLKEREVGLPSVPYKEIKLNQISRDPNQPRTFFDENKLKELAASIKAYGVLNPILVRQSEQTGKYDLVAGERRLRAAELVGLSTIPAIVDKSNDDDETTLAKQLVENLQRSDLTPIERATAIGILRDTYNLSIREVADKLGISKSMVQRSLDILNLPDDLLNALKEGASESKVLLLSKIEDEDIRASYLKDIEVFTRDQLQKDIEKNSKNAKVEDITMSPEDRRLAEEMQQSLGLKVKLLRNMSNKNKGRVIIDFYSDDDLQEIFRKIVTEQY
jgi:ParB family transcriptional regulator, chromosome partitioning protein